MCNFSEKQRARLVSVQILIPSSSLVSSHYFFHCIVNYPIQWITKAIDLWTTRTWSFAVTKLDAFWFVRHVSKWSWSSSKYSSLTTVLLQNCMQLNPFQLSGIVRFSFLSYSTIIKHKDIGHKWGKRGYFLPTLRDIKVYCQMISIFKGNIQSWQKYIYASCPDKVTYCTTVSRK